MCRWIQEQMHMSIISSTILFLALFNFLSENCSSIFYIISDCDHLFQQHMLPIRDLEILVQIFSANKEKTLNRGPSLNDEKWFRLKHCYNENDVISLCADKKYRNNLSFEISSIVKQVCSRLDRKHLRISLKTSQSCFP